MFYVAFNICSSNRARTSLHLFFQWVQLKRIFLGELMMVKQVLVIGYDGITKRKTKWECPHHAERIHILPHTSDAIKRLVEENAYVLVVFFTHGSDDVFAVRSIRNLTDIPILVLAEEYKGMEKIDILEAGADEYIPYPETIWEAIASCHALIRRYTMLNQQRESPMNLTIQGEVFIHGDCRKVFISGKELQFTSREYDLFTLLAASPERVYTYAALFEMIWDGGQSATENSVHSCVRRIRRKLENVQECPCCIENIRGVGYFFRLNKV